MSDTPTTENLTNTSPVEQEHKIFVGNLSFKTSKEDLEAFARPSGNVLKATVITRRSKRSLGYGFVTFATEEETAQAAKDLNSKELDSRKVNAEVAQPRKPVEKKKRRRNKKPANADDNNEKGLTTSRSRNTKNRQNKKNTASDEKPPRSTEPSKTTLFAGNLPYSTTNDDLKDIFKDFKLVSAYVSRMNNGRSKGYGFVELEDEEEQTKALENVKNVVLNGRVIYLKAAFTPYKAPEEHEKKSEETEASNADDASTTDKTNDTRGEDAAAPVDDKEDYDEFVIVESVEVKKEDSANITESV